MLLEDRTVVTAVEKVVRKGNCGIWGAGNVLVLDLDPSYVHEFNL